MSVYDLKSYKVVRHFKKMIEENEAEMQKLITENPCMDYGTEIYDLYCYLCETIRDLNAEIERLEKGIN